MPADVPEDYEILTEIVNHHKNLMNTFMIAKVLTYDYTTQKAQVLPVTKGKRINPDTEELENYVLPAISNVPVSIFGNNSFADTYPIAPGTTVLLGFCARSMDEWLLTANDSHETQDTRRFDLKDAVIIGIINPFVSPLLQVDPVARVISGAQIKLGSISATQKIMLGDLYMESLETYLTALTVYIDAMATALTALGAAGMATATSTHATAKSAFLAGVYTSLKVKAE